MRDLEAKPRLNLRGKSVTTFIVNAVHETLAELNQGALVEVVTDTHRAIDSDIAAWCRTSGHRLVGAVGDTETRVYTIEKGPRLESGHTLAAVISDDGLLELLSPLGFALAAALEGHAVSLYFQGPAVRVLAPGFSAKMRGLARPFSRFPRRGLAEAGHVAPQEKLAQLHRLGAKLFACGPSMEHYKVDHTDLAFEGVTIAAYFTFMEQMDSADIHLFI